MEKAAESHPQPIEKKPREVFVSKRPSPEKSGADEKSRPSKKSKQRTSPFNSARSKGGPFVSKRPIAAAPVEETAAPEETPSDAPESTPVPRRRIRLPRMKRKTVVISLLLATLVVAILSYTYSCGVGKGRLLATQERAAKDIREGASGLSPEALARLDAALIDLRAGRSQNALGVMKSLLAEFPRTPSLPYLTAMAALQEGDVDQAEKMTLRSIEAGQRVSDSLAMQSVLVTQKATDTTQMKMRDPRVRSEQLLREAINADVANPYPYYELATLLRYQGRQEEAFSLIRSAQARLNPVDSHLVMDITLALMERETAPVGTLPAADFTSDDPRKLLPAALVAMRKGDFPQAVAILHKTKALLPADVFDYLVNDPALRRYASQPSLSEFYSR